jgi:hypothetical protein
MKNLTRPKHQMWNPKLNAPQFWEIILYVLQCWPNFAQDDLP